MRATDIPVRFPLTWAADAGGSYIRTIPTNSQIGVHDGWASLRDGFVPLNFSPIGSGGIPPFGQDFNGILAWVTQWAQWQAAGNFTPYDATFSTAIGGYPSGAVLASTTLGVFWQSTADNNTTDPDGMSAANWARVIPLKASAAEVIAGTNDTDFITPKALHDSGFLPVTLASLGFTFFQNGVGTAIGFTLLGVTYYLQFGAFTLGANSTTTITFPVPVTTIACGLVNGGAGDHDDSDMRANGWTTTAMTVVNSDGASHGGRWFMIGY